MTDAVAPAWAINAVLKEQRLNTLYDARSALLGRVEGAAVLRLVHAMALQHQALRALQAMADRPIELILHCPVCHMQHIDAVDEMRNPGWMNPDHVSHSCLGCGCVWRPCDRPTEGVAMLERHGRADTWPARARRAGNSHDTGNIMVQQGLVNLAVVEPDAAPVPAPAQPPANCRDRMRRERNAGRRAWAVAGAIRRISINLPVLIWEMSDGRLRPWRDPKTFALVLRAAATGAVRWRRIERWHSLPSFGDAPYDNVLHMLLRNMRLTMKGFEKFEAVGSVQDLEELRVLALDAVALAKQAIAERDAWYQRYLDISDDLVSIPEVTLDQLARMVSPRN